MDFTSEADFLNFMKTQKGKKRNRCTQCNAILPRTSDNSRCVNCRNSDLGFSLGD